MGPEVNQNFEPPVRIIISRCLLGVACRYDGATLPNSPIIPSHSSIELIDVCPEVDIGLGIPRPKIKLVINRGQRQLLQHMSGLDLTKDMEEFAYRFLDRAVPIDGFILKSRSPSCALYDAKLFSISDDNETRPVGVGPGVFAFVVIKRYPDLPKADESQLLNLFLRWHFFTAVFTMARLRYLESHPTIKNLTHFHTRHKYLIMAYDPALLKELGKKVGLAKKEQLTLVIQQYVSKCRMLFLEPPSVANITNVFYHIFGYFSELLSPSDRQMALELIEGFRLSKEPLHKVITLFRKWSLMFDVPYLRLQYFLQPFPDELILAY